jgi:hypothetical protein
LNLPILNGGIRSITVINRGGGYTSAPRVAISSAPTGGITGIATAIMISGIVVCTDNVNPSAQSVQAVRLINPGAGYTVPPGVRFIGGGGSGAAATSLIDSGRSWIYYSNKSRIWLYNSTCDYI